MTKILLIENNPVMRPALHDLLQTSEIEVITAMTVPDALAMLTHIRGVRLVIADGDLPEMDSVALIKRLRTQEQYRALPLLIYSIEEKDKLRRKVLDAGANLFLSPPFTVADLRESVHKLLSSH
ncbi:MAG TPA: response regulator [Anaerolineae bacterium]|nr:response regulator [Anaerolineae bacterium]